MTRPTCDLCEEEAMLQIPHNGQRYRFCPKHALELKPYAWGEEEWKTYISQFSLIVQQGGRR